MLDPELTGPKSLIELVRPASYPVFRYNKHIRSALVGASIDIIIIVVVVVVIFVVVVVNSPLPFSHTQVIQQYGGPEKVYL